VIEEEMGENQVTCVKKMKRRRILHDAEVR
jgi:hypothetical protein